MKTIRSLLIIILALFFLDAEAQSYRILPLGNSLTQGWGSTTIPDRVGYRSQFTFMVVKLRSTAPDNRAYLTNY